MDKISDILDSIKDRLNNPLFVSFIVSWILCNWEITVVLLWYDERLWNGYSNAFDFIYATRGWWKSLLCPAFLATAYVAFTPWLKNAINLINLASDNWGNQRQEEMSRDTRVNFEAFRKKFNELKERENSLAAIENEQKDTKEKMNNLEAQLSKTRTTIDEKEKLLEEQRKNYSDLVDLHKIEKDNLEKRIVAEKEGATKAIQSYTDISILLGRWELRYLDKKIPSRELTISNGQTIYKTGSQYSFYKNQAFFKKDENKVYLATRLDSEHESFFYDITINIDGSMKGLENNNKVILERLPTEVS